MGVSSKAELQDQAATADRAAGVHSMMNLVGLPQGNAIH